MLVISLRHKINHPIIRIVKNIKVTYDSSINVLRVETDGKLSFPRHVEMRQTTRVPAAGSALHASTTRKLGQSHSTHKLSRTVVLGLI